MTDVRGRCASLVEAPLAVAFFLAVIRSGVRPAELAQERRSCLDIAAQCQALLDPWSGYAVEARQEVLSHRRLVEEICRTVVEDPRAAWWWEPLRRTEQAALRSRRERDGRLPVGDPALDAYAQRPSGGVTTSTAASGFSGLHAAFAHHVGDTDVEHPPFLELAVRAATDARVFEVTGPDDWHHLSVSYPETPGRRLRRPPGIIDEVTPAWAAASRSWDGVHLTFGGYLSSLYVPVRSSAGVTTLWTWESERTVWLDPSVLTQEARREWKRLEPIAGRVIDLPLSSANARDGSATWLTPRDR